MNNPLISLSVPVYGTESTLPALLDSILEQQPLHESSVREGDFFLTEEASLRSLRSSRFLPIEILIVNDGSPGGSSLPKIIKPYKKKFKALGVPLTLLEHRKNLGLVEARRTGAMAASGEWVCCIDSDDILPPEALLNFYKGLLASGNGNLAYAADIIHGKMRLFVPGLDPSDKKAAEKFNAFSKSVQSIHKGFLSGEDVLENFLIKKEHSSFLCAKLFRTRLLQEVYAELPHTFCTMAEDLLLYFFVLLKKPSYCGIDSFVYNYTNDKGITSNSEVTSLERWEKACTAASVFTVIFDYLQEHPLDCPRAAELKLALEKLCLNHAMMNLHHLERVTPSLREEAYAMLCDYWGEDYVRRVEKMTK